MDLVTARRVIEALADGVNPATGEVLAPGSPIECPDVIRALHVALNAIDNQTIRRERVGSSPPNAGKPWLPEDDQALAREFDAGKSVAEIAKAFQRTEGSIAARLVRIGKVAARDLAYTARLRGSQA